MVEVTRRAGYLLLAVLLGHIILISAQISTRSGARLLETVTFGVFSEVQRGTAGVVGSARQVWRHYFDLRGLSDENARLRAEVAVLQVSAQEARALVSRGERLEQLLELRSRIPAKTIAADVVAGDATAWSQTVTINVGSRHGVQNDFAVLSARGVVGRVVGEPAGRAARVQLLVDRYAAAGALTERARAGGVVVGQGPGRLLRMDYVSNLADVQVGDAVVTSGVDGIYPKGYVIGQVESVSAGSNAVYHEIAIRPTVDFSALEEVLVILEPLATEDDAGTEDDS